MQTDYTPKISVIVPVYNVEKYLRRCIDSILAQTFADFELLLIDDGSKDSSGAICDEYAEKDNRILVFHKENGGVSSARNVGLDNACGEWITFVDADDWVSPKLYDIIFNSKDYKDVELINFSFYSVFKSEQVPVRLLSADDKVEFIKKQMVEGRSVVWNMIIKRDFVLSKKLKFNTTLKIGEDFDLLIRAYLGTGMIEIVNEPLYFYNRDNEESALHKMKTADYDHIINAIVGITDVFKEYGVYDVYKAVLCWKILRAKQDYVLSISTHEKFLSIYPECHKYIISCPLINKKIKLMMWLLTHRLGFLTRGINIFRYLVGKKIKNV